MKHFLSSKASRGQSLIEILIASSVAGVILVAIASLIIVSLRASRQSREVALAQSLIQDMSAAVRGLVSQDWHSLWGSSGLAAYWALDEGVNDKTFELVNGNNGTINLGSLGNTGLGNAWQSSANCKAGQCLSFDGSDDNVDVPDSTSLDITDAITIGAWIYPQSEYIGYAAHPINKWSGTSDANFVLYYFGTTSGINRSVAFYANAGGTWKDISASYVLSLNQWYYIVLVYTSANGGQLYINGQPIGGLTGSGLLATNNQSLKIGGPGYINGRIDEVRIYNRALSSTEISNLSNGVSKLYPQNIGGLWQVKEGEETVLSSGINFIRSFFYQAVQRDNSTGGIVSSGGSDDPSTKKVTYQVRWGTRSVSSNEYLTRSQTKIFVQTDWAGGSAEEGPVSLPTNKFSTSTNLITTSTGEIRLKLTTE